MATYWENSCSFGLRYVSWYKCLIVSLVFSHLGFWSGNLFLIAPFPDLCLLIPLFQKEYLPDLYTRLLILILNIQMYNGFSTFIAILEQWKQPLFSSMQIVGFPMGRLISVRIYIKSLHLVDSKLHNRSLLVVL